MFGKSIVLGFAALAAVSFVSSAAIAQTAAECEAGITEVNEMVATKTAASTGGDNQSLDEARSMSQEAQSAHDGGDFARCMELVTTAKAALEG